MELGLGENLVRERPAERKSLIGNSSQQRQTKWVILVRRTSNVQCSSPRPRVTLLATAVAPPATTTSHPTANVTQASVSSYHRDSILRK